MAVPSIHKCLQLCDENEHLQRKLKRLRQKNEILGTQLSEITAKLQLQQLIREYVTTRDVQVQTEARPWHRGGLKEDKTKQDTNQLLQMYNALQKRYEKEIKTNKEQSNAIVNLHGKVQRLESQLQAAHKTIQQLEQIPVKWISTSTGRRSTPTPEKSSAHRHKTRSKKCTSVNCHCPDLLLEIEKLHKEKEKLSKERKMLKDELAGLDKDFFDEIEDLKYALQESSKLNKAYDNCLKQICVKYGLSFPDALPTYCRNM
ncbi:centrosomal protein of 290 kDa-like isoform X2 [Acipenser ruthenus]|uniref:centrosomal protein of 290 kDa-like isoform X2 n=1 Tax=Acipenser ruthenus TaxID=7906 RepID=UPI002740C344|nr:centrosomal protein of 290 kDa-like isoform X2 [Acipenser ruthenus]